MTTADNGGPTVTTTRPEELARIREAGYDMSNVLALALNLGISECEARRMLLAAIEREKHVRILPAHHDGRLLVDLVLDQAVEALKDLEFARKRGLSVLAAEGQYQGTLHCLRAVLHADATPAHDLVVATLEARR
jgi:hypothetical protein